MTEDIDIKSEMELTAKEIADLCEDDETESVYSLSDSSFSTVPEPAKVEYVIKLQIEVSSCCCNDRACRVKIKK